MTPPEPVNPFALNDNPGESETPNTESKNPFAFDDTTKPAEETAPVEAQAAEVIDQTDEILAESNLLETEGDGDIFWVIQRTIWSIVKSLLMLGVVILLIWLIWGDVSNFSFKGNTKSSSPKAIVEKTVKKDSKTTKQTTQKQPVRQNIPQTRLQPGRNEAVTAARWNFWLHERWQIDAQSTINTAVNWLRDTESLFAVPFNDQITGTARDQRTYELKKLLERVNELLKRSAAIQTNFTQDIARFQLESNQSAALEENLSNQIIAQFNARQGENIPNQLEAKIEAGNAKFAADNNIWIRQLILERVSVYTQSLERVKNIILTNQEAIVEDIQVVNFPEDPFERVLEPQN